MIRYLPFFFRCTWFVCIWFCVCSGVHHLASLSGANNRLCVASLLLWEEKKYYAINIAITMQRLSGERNKTGIQFTPNAFLFRLSYLVINPHNVNVSNKKICRGKRKMYTASDVSCSMFDLWVIHNMITCTFKQVSGDSFCQ